MTPKELYRHARYYIALMVDKELTLYAASLSYYTIFTIVPLLLITLTIFTSLPSFQEHYETIKSFIFENLVPVHSEAVTSHIDGFLQNSGKLGAIGLIMVIVAALLFFQNFEYIVSKIFKTRQRTIWESITTYWTLLTLTPMALVASFYISGKVHTLLNSNEIISGWINIMSLLPYLIIWALFFLIFKIASVEKTSTKAAALSSFIIALVWNIAKSGFISYVVMNKSYATIYGSFSTLLFFLLWIYVSWIIFIYGLKLCYLIDCNYCNSESDEKAKEQCTLEEDRQN
ncbi:MAG: YihY family inner membrane protein [Campylobacterota bacterium]|nr:YihY family inner membrane protein [Campylobacterota bacterium]